MQQSRGGQPLPRGDEEGLELVHPTVFLTFKFFLLGREGEEVGSNYHGCLASDFVPVLLQTLLQRLFQENLQPVGQEVTSSEGTRRTLHIRQFSRHLVEDLTLVLPSCHSFLVLSYLNRRSVLLFLSSPTAGVFSFMMILYLRQSNQNYHFQKSGTKETSHI